MSKRPVAKGQATRSTSGPPSRGGPGLQITGSSRPNFIPWVIGIVFIAVVVGLVVALVGGSDSSAPASSNVKAVMAKLTAVPSSVYESVGVGTSNNPPKKVSGPALEADGKPRVVYVGAEYCPYCATERWAMVQALSRFGSFSTLSLTHSSSQDTFPNTQTFSFHGSSYTSKYLSFDGTETQSNQLVNGNYATLDTPASDVQALESRYSDGSIPFVDFGNRYVLSGATYDPGVLQGKTAQQIADALSDSSSDIAKGAIGSANVLTAAICATTDQQPANVCGTATMKEISKKLANGDL